MWTPTTRQQHSRPVTRYQTDLTDAEWLVIAPHLPKPCATGRPREWPMREIINGIFYVMRSGCPWRPQQRRQKTLEALTEQLAGLASQHPVLMIFEDLHWIDPTSVEARLTGPWAELKLYRLC
jgi:transposase